MPGHDQAAGAANYSLLCVSAVKETSCCLVQCDWEIALGAMQLPRQDPSLRPAAVN